MRQLITRLDDELHARLKAIAADRGTSLNSLVVELLATAADDTATRSGVRERARRTGRLVVPPAPASVPSWDDVDRATRGAGTLVSAALAAERAAR